MAAQMQNDVLLHLAEVPGNADMDESEVCGAAEEEAVATTEFMLCSRAGSETPRLAPWTLKLLDWRRGGIVGADISASRRKLAASARMYISASSSDTRPSGPGTLLRRGRS